MLKLLAPFLPLLVVNFPYQLFLDKLLFNILAHKFLYKHLVFKLPVDKFIFKLLVFKILALFLPLLVFNFPFRLLLDMLFFIFIVRNFLYKFSLYQLKFHFVILKLIDLTAPSGCPRWSMTCWRPVPI